MIAAVCASWPFDRMRALFAGLPAITPVAIQHMPNSVLERARASDEYPYYVGERPRLATCGGAAWFHGTRLATVNLLGNAVVTYTFDPVRGRLTLLQTLSGARGIARPENLAFSPDGALLAVTNSVGGTVTIFAVDTQTHLIDGTPIFSIECGAHVNPHGIAFSPDGGVLLFSSVEHPGTLRTYRLRRSASGVEVVPMQDIANAHAPLRPKGVAFAPDGRFVAVAYGSNAEVYAHRDRAGFLAIYAFDPRSGCARDPLSISNRRLGLRCAEDVNFVANGSHIAVTDQARDAVMIVPFDAATGRIGRSKLEISNPAAQLSFPHGNAVSPDGRFLAVANYGDDKVTLYELDPARLPRR